MERREQKQMEAALKLQEERYSAADMAAELKAKMEVCWAHFYIHCLWIFNLFESSFFTQYSSSIGTVI